MIDNNLKIIICYQFDNLKQLDRRPAGEHVKPSGAQDARVRGAGGTGTPVEGAMRPGNHLMYLFCNFY